MHPRFPLKDIAFQAGLSLATVDRVIHGRPGVRPVTVARVRAAVAELERQYSEAGLRGRRLAIDVVMEAPRRFSRAVQEAFEAELPSLRPASLTARFHLAERMTAEDLSSIMSAIRRRGSHGVVLKSPARAETAELAAGLMAAGIPVLTYVTDLPEAARLAYVGMDNHAAGASAAWLMGNMLMPGPCRILLSLSSAAFAGEEQREAGFTRTLAAHFPALTTVRISEGMGVDRSTYDLAAAALARHRDIAAVYSIGGGNQALLDAFAHHRRACRVFAAHDLDRINARLLAERRITFVIHHDLRNDARAACHLLLKSHRMLPGDFRIAPSPIGIATPFDPAPPSA